MSVLEKPITLLSGIGPQRAKELHKLGLYTIEDVLYHFPRRYEDRSNLKPISQLVNGATETVAGRIMMVNEQQIRKGMTVIRVEIMNDTGKITAIWYNQKYLKSQLIVGKEIIVTGKVDLRFGKQMTVNDFEFINEQGDQKHTARIIPVHGASEKINSKFLRNMVYAAVEKYSQEIEEILPQEVIREYRLMPLPQAIQEIHFPNSWEQLNIARYRLVFQEFLTLLIGLQKSSMIMQDKKGIAHNRKEALANEFINSLGFTLTDAQKRVILEIKKDMEQEKAMYRLVQGDVGCGKTMIAIYALLKALQGGYQGALMAPTEILAEQHYLNLHRMLMPMGIEPILLKGSLKKKEKQLALEEIKEGRSKIVIGTHALIQKDVEFQHLGVAVIDEQHRFGVKQRVALEEKGACPDVLVLTATPIPRSLALTLYGDMDLSIIDQLPPGRQPIRTYHVGEAKRSSMYEFIRKEINKGHQAYIVCPLVDESEKMDLENATQLAEELAYEVFPEFKVGLLHGKMATADKEGVMEEFRAGELQVLVSTTVIEVGVDVPNANIMVIENAERFGLAQLHQLRGRVGRGTAQSHCILISDTKTDDGKKRMQIMTGSNNGFVIAEEDLKLRGPGEVLGVRQHGLPDLKIADLIKDIKILEASKKAAANILADGIEQDKYKPLTDKVKKIYENKVKG